MISQLRMGEISSGLHKGLLFIVKGEVHRASSCLLLCPCNQAATATNLALARFYRMPPLVDKHFTLTSTSSSVAVMMPGATPCPAQGKIRCPRPVLTVLSAFKRKTKH